MSEIGEPGWEKIISAPIPRFTTPQKPPGNDSPFLLPDLRSPEPTGLPFLPNKAVFGIGNLPGVGRDGCYVGNDALAQFDGGSHVATCSRWKEQTDVRIVDYNDP